MTGFIVSVFPFRNRVSTKEAFEGLELGEGKLSRPVLRGPGGRKAAWLLGSYPLPLRPFFPKLTQYPPLPIPLGWIAIAFCCEALPRYGSLHGFAPRFPHRGIV